MPIDLDKPILQAEHTLPELMERTARGVEKLVEIQTPGVQGIEGTESVPECSIETFDLQPGQRFTIGGNRRRKALRIYVSPVQYAGTLPADAIVDISTRDGWESPGRAIEIGDEFCLFDSTNSIYVRAITRTGTIAVTPVTVTIVQENS